MNQRAVGPSIPNTMTMHARIAAVAIALLSACSGGPSPIEDSSVPYDGATDSETPDVPDAGRDSATPDAARDSGFDSVAPDASDAAIVDAGADVADAAPPCECTSGPCCDGCNFRPSTDVCATAEPFPRSCDHASIWCGSRALTLRVAQTSTHCSGASSACNGNVDDTSFAVDCSQPTPGNFEQYGVCLPPSGELPARCALSCGF